MSQKPSCERISTGALKLVLMPFNFRPKTQDAKAIETTVEKYLQIHLERTPLHAARNE